VWTAEGWLDVAIMLDLWRVWGCLKGGCSAANDLQEIKIESAKQTRKAKRCLGNSFLSTLPVLFSELFIAARCCTGLKLYDASSNGQENFSSNE
jgi:hypothetical protein